MITVWRGTGTQNVIVGPSNIYVFNNHASGSEPPPTTGGIEMKIVLDLFSGETVKLTPSIGGIGGTGVM